MTRCYANHLKRLASVAAALGLALGATQGARGAGFQFSPTRVDLTAHDHVALLTVTNSDDAPLRIEARALDWTQRPADGQPVLVSSKALLVFPELLTIPPHAKRRLRVAMTDPPGASESTYMISIAEIGAFATKKTPGAAVSLTLQANIPVFLAPPVGRRAGAITGANVGKRRLAFAVVNTGTLHFVIKDARVTGLGADERPLFASQLSDGYVLAGERRKFLVDLPRKDCADLRALTIHVNAGEQQLVQTMDVPPGACDP